MYFSKVRGERERSGEEDQDQKEEEENEVMTWTRMLKMIQNMMKLVVFRATRWWYSQKKIAMGIFDLWGKKSQNLFPGLPFPETLSQS